MPLDQHGRDGDLKHFRPGGTEHGKADDAQAFDREKSADDGERNRTRINSTLATFSPELIILELGANDGLRGFPPAQMKDNLAEIVTRAQAFGTAVVLLGIRIPTNYGMRYTTAFENVFRQVAEERDIPWVEFFMEGVALNDELLQSDRIHPNSAAQIILLDNAWPIISATLSATRK